MRRPTWTHEKSLSNRYRMLATALELGDDPNDLTNFGTLEDMIKGDEIYRANGARITYVQPNAFESSSFFVMVAVESVEKKDVNRYTETIWLKREPEKDADGKTVYRIQNTAETEHVCTGRAFQRTRKVLPLPSCKHAIAAVEAVQDGLTKAIAEARLDNVRVTSFYEENQLLPVPDELLDFYETVKYKKQVEKFGALQAFLHAEEKVVLF